jgi:hypothetical protein
MGHKVESLFWGMNVDTSIHNLLAIAQVVHIKRGSSSFLKVSHTVTVTLLSHFDHYQIVQLYYLQVFMTVFPITFCAIVTLP